MADATKAERFRPGHKSPDWPDNSECNIINVSSDRTTINNRAAGADTKKAHHI